MEGMVNLRWGPQEYHSAPVDIVSHEEQQNTRMLVRGMMLTCSQGSAVVEAL